MSVHTKNSDMVRWTCGETVSGDRKLGKATDNWGSTAISTRQADAQHWWPWANGFIPRTTLPKNRKGNQATKGCERDEWPPALFWPGDEFAEKKKMSQRVRMVWYEENAKGGQIWSAFCDNNAAVTTKTVKKKKQTYLNSKFIRHKGTARTVVGKGKDGTTSKSGLRLSPGSDSRCAAC
jgi:hypothetical protein